MLSWIQVCCQAWCVVTLHKCVERFFNTDCVCLGFLMNAVLQECCREKLDEELWRLASSRLGLQGGFLETSTTHWVMLGAGRNKRQKGRPRANKHEFIGVLKAFGIHPDQFFFQKRLGSDRFTAKRLCSRAHLP